MARDKRPAVMPHLIHNIEIRERYRRSPLDEAVVGALAESIGKLGLRTPITVVADGEDLFLVSGRHRLEAARRLGWDSIDAFTVFDDPDGDEVRLWEISENLHRAELTVQERAEHIAEWIRLTAEKQSPAQLAPVKSRREDGRGGGVGQGINAAVRELGIDRTEAQRAVKIDAIAPEAKEAARAAGLDNNQSALLQVAREATERQAEKVEELRRREEAKKEANRLRRETARQRHEVVVIHHPCPTPPTRAPEQARPVDIVMPPLGAPKNSPVMVQVMVPVDTYNRFRAAAAAEGLAVKDWIVQVAERSLRDGGGDV